MPASVDRCVSSLLPKLKQNYPKKSEKVLTRMAWAMCQDQYKRRKKKGSNESMSDDLTLRWDSKMQIFDTLTEAMSDIGGNGVIRHMYPFAKEILESEKLGVTMLEEMTENIVTDQAITTDSSDPTLVESGAPAQSPHIFIRGTAIGEGVTQNLNEYLAEELQQAAPTLTGVPLQLDHGRTMSANAGKVLVSSFDPNSKSIDYVARLRRLEENVDAFKAVELGDVDSVSIGANINDVLCNICGESKLNGDCSHHVGREYDGETATRIGIGLEFFELSLTPFGAYRGANIAGVVSHHSTNLDDALALFTESWKQKFGEQKQMPEQDKDQKADLELTKTQKKLTEAEQSNQELTERVKRTLARTIADSESEMGQRKPDELNTRIESLKSKSVEALELLSETTQERLVIYRRDQSAVSRSQGIVSEDTEEDDPTEVAVEDLKTFLREQWMKWPEPSESAKLTVRQFRKNTYNPNYNAFARKNKERGR